MMNSDTNQPILVLTTGGTIDKSYFDALSSYKVGDPQVRRLLDIARVRFPYKIREIARKDSLELDNADREAICRAVAEATTTRIVVTHGTDTMTKTAKALGDVGGKTVVFVGAMAPALFAETDAQFNLGMAFATAQVAPPGVYITMSGQVFPADRVVKDRDRGMFIVR